MSMLDMLSDPDVWEQFYEYRTTLISQNGFPAQLRAFIDRKGYLPVCARIRSGAPFPLPKKAVISKLSTKKQRTVYTYPQEENTVLKLLTYLLLRKYDCLFSPNLYSFRPARNAKDAIRFLTGVRGLREMHAYKVDISNYFNSVPVERFLPMLEEATADDPALYHFLSSLLREPQVLDGGLPVTEEKGIMAGTPLASFYANLYLRALDRMFFERRVPYARYSDDIILFAPTAEQVQGYAAELRAFLAEQGLSVNPAKECFTAPEQPWVFLGFCCCGGKIDIAPASVIKLKHKMRRKARALQRWRQRKNVSGEQAAAAFIRIFNRKLLESAPASGSELTWSCWFFPVLTTVESLHTVDLYAQDCLRWLISGTHTKARYNVRYADLKRLGYRSLVHAYYSFAEAEQQTASDDRNIKEETGDS